MATKRKLLRDDPGQALVISAVFMGLVALGFLAIAVDAGSLFRQRRMAQSAADAVSQAAAQEIALGYSSDEQSVANQVAKLNGFDTTLATNPATVTLTTPSSGAFAGSNYIQATVSKPIHTIFLGAFNSKLAYMSVAAQSIAGGSNSSPTCVCVTGGSTTDLQLSNNSKISASACGVVVNSTSSEAITMTGGATLSALTLGTVSSSWDNSSNINDGASIAASTKIVQGISNGCSVTPPAAPSYGACLPDPGASGGTVSVGPAATGGTICYTSLSVGANSGVTTLNPGIYVISNGNLHFESGSNGHSNLGGNGVFFYLLANGSLVIDNGANVNLVAGDSSESGGAIATTTGVYNGILVYQPVANTTAMTIAGGSTAYMSGSIFAQGSAMTLSNGTGSTISGGILAQTLVMSGGATLNAISNGMEGSLVLTYPKLVQ